MLDRHIRHQVRARDGVIHERAADELTGGVVDGVLGQRLAEPLRHAAVDLARDDGVIQHVAAIADRRIGNDRHRAGRRIDFDLGDVAAVRERRRCLDGCLGVEALGDHRVACQFSSTLGHFEQRHLARRSAHAEPAVAVIDIAVARLQQHGGDALAFLDHLVGSNGNRAADIHRRARGDGAEPRHVARRVAGGDRHRLGRDAEPARGHFAKHSRVPLPAAAGADADGHLVAAWKSDVRGLFGERAGDLQIATDADAAQPALLLRRFLARGKAGITAKLERAFERAGKVAAVVGVAESGGVGNLVGLDQIAPAQFGGVDAGLIGGGIDQPLHQVARLRPAGAAIGTGQQRVGEDAARIHLRLRDVVDCRQAAGNVRGEDEMRHAGDIGADIAEAFDA